MLDVRRIRVLAEVAERGSFSAAAEALHMTQSAVSQQIAALERESGHTLLMRGRGTARLTDAGRVVVEHGGAVLARLRSAEEELDAIAGVRVGRLRMATFPSVGATMVPEAVRRFRDRHPEVTLSLVQGEPHETLPRIAAGELDLAMTFDYPGVEAPVEHADLEREPILTEPMLLALPAEHPLAGREAVDLREMNGETWLTGSGGGPCQAIALHACRAAGFQPEVSFESDDDAILLGLIASGVGVSLMPRLCTLSPPPGVAIRPLSDPVPPRRIWATTLARPYRPLAAAAMTEVLQEITPPLAAWEDGAVAAS